MYFVIVGSQGSADIESLTKEELIKKLEEKYYGDVDFYKEILEKEISFWGDNIMIIKGEIAVPTSTTKIFYDVD